MEPYSVIHFTTVIFSALFRGSGSLCTLSYQFQISRNHYNKNEPSSMQNFKADSKKLFKILSHYQVERVYYGTPKHCINLQLQL